MLSKMLPPNAAEEYNSRASSGRRDRSVGKRSNAERPTGTAVFPGSIVAERDWKQQEQQLRQEQQLQQRRSCPSKNRRRSRKAPGTLLTNAMSSENVTRTEQASSGKRELLVEKRSDAEHPSETAMGVCGNLNWDKFRRATVAECNWKQQEQQLPHPSSCPSKNRRRSRKAPGTLRTSAAYEAKTTRTETRGRNCSKELTKQIAMDCEMVGIGDGTESMLARVSLVNRHGNCIYDTYVKPREQIRDYRTAVSGIRPHHVAGGEDFKAVQARVAEILRGRLLIGHALKHDLSVLFLSHPKRNVRDTSRYKPFRKITKGNTPSLKKLAAELLGLDIQRGEHSSVEDARAAMQLYLLYRNQWEKDIFTRR